MSRSAGRATRSDEDGFSLIEVVVSVALVLLVFTSVSTFFVRSVSTAAGLQRRDAAVQLGDLAMDVVRAVPAQALPGSTTRLVAGRRPADVDVQWAAAPAELATTTRAADGAATQAAQVDTSCFTRETVPAGQPVVPLRAQCQRGGVTYTVDTFIGTCFQPPSTAACSNAAGPTGNVLQYRVVVVVSWRGGAGTSCGASSCRYLVTTLVNVDGDPVFVAAGEASRARSEPV